MTEPQAPETLHDVPLSKRRAKSKGEDAAAPVVYRSPLDEELEEPSAEDDDVDDLLAGLLPSRDKAVQVNKRFITEGLWIKDPTFGDEAFLKVAGAHEKNPAFSQRQRKLRNKIMKRGKPMTPEQIAVMLPDLYAHAVLKDYRGIDLQQMAERLNRHEYRVPVDDDGVPTGVVQRREKTDRNTWEWVGYLVKMDGGKVDNSEDGRRLLLAAFMSEAADRVAQLGGALKTFDVTDEEAEAKEAEARGN